MSSLAGASFVAYSSYFSCILQFFTTWVTIVERLESFLASHGFRYSRCCKSGCPLSK
ncbi:hypothetical protein Hdeb2414_s0009g00311181 [Helianthus debilis subsp. tardiflorus]